jgi:hypothetical protein
MLLWRWPVERIEYEIELERTNGPAHHTTASLPLLTKGQRLKAPVGGGFVYAEVVEVTKLTTDEPVKWRSPGNRGRHRRKARSRSINSTPPMMIDGRT